MKRIFVLFLMLSVTAFVNAQPGRFRPEMISDDELIQMQTKDLAMWLNLKGSTEEKFIKEYSAFRKEISEVARTAGAPQKAESEEEIEKVLLNNFSVSEKILEIREKYYHIFRKFMKPSEIRLMYHLENESGKRMHDGPDRPPRPDGPGGPGAPDGPGGLGMPPPPPHHPDQQHHPAVGAE